MFKTDPMKGQPAVAGCCMSRQRCSDERPGDAGGDDILMLSDRRIVGEFSSARRHGSVSREALYDEVWRHPILRVAERYGVSSSFMARVCTSMNVPRPPRGHWTKLEHGKPSPQVPPPAACPGDNLIWRRGDASGPARYPLPKPPERQVAPPWPRISRSARRPLVRGGRDLFTKGKVIESGYLKPSQRRLMDVVVSEPMLDDALDTANALFLRLEAYG